MHKLRLLLLLLLPLMMYSMFMLMLMLMFMSLLARLGMEGQGGGEAGAGWLGGRCQPLCRGCMQSVVGGVVMRRTSAGVPGAGDELARPKRRPVWEYPCRLSVQWFLYHALMPAHDPSTSLVTGARGLLFAVTRLRPLQEIVYAVALRRAVLLEQERVQGAAKGSRDDRTYPLA